MLKSRFLFFLAIVLFGCILAFSIQNDLGNVTVKDVRFVGSNGNAMSALLYIPDNVSVQSPAPGILAIHGYINSRETQSGFAIEFARRGYVVLALDQTGHGYSDPPAFANGFGGPDGLSYLTNLPFVDKTKIGLEGHSMGGWAVQMAAAAAPQDYHAMVLEGSSTGTFGAPEGTPDSPRNLLVVFSRFDEFSALMWEADIPADIVKGNKLKTLFGTSDDVVIGKLYGDINSGTGRKLAMPAVTHPGDHLSRDAIGAAIEWFDQTLGHNSNITADDQIWYWKEIGTLLALIGLVLLIFPVTAQLLSLPQFDAAHSTPPPEIVQSVTQLNFNMALTAVLPVLTFFPLQTIANVLLPPTSILPQQITNGVLLWAWGTGLLTLLAVYFWNRKHKRSLDELGMPLNKATIINAFMVAVLCCEFLYIVVMAADFFFTVDFRFWVVALKLMSPDQFGLFLTYLVPFTVYFLVLSLSLHNPLRRQHTQNTIWLNGSVVSGGFVVLLLVQYAPLFAGGSMTIASQPLLTIVAFQFVPLLFLIAAVSTFCFARTGNIYTGAFINGIFVTWYMVAGTATQAIPFWF